MNKKVTKKAIPKEVASTDKLDIKLNPEDFYTIKDNYVINKKYEDLKYKNIVFPKVEIIKGQTSTDHPERFMLASIDKEQIFGRNIGHKSSISSNQEESPKNLHIEYVSVKDDFRGQQYTERNFILLWAYLKSIKILKDINNISLDYAASVPVIGTYNRSINEVGYYNKTLDMLDVNSMSKEYKLILHNILRESHTKAYIGTYFNDLKFYKKNDKKYDSSFNENLFKEVIKEMKKTKTKTKTGKGCSCEPKSTISAKDRIALLSIHKDHLLKYEKSLKKKSSQEKELLMYGKLKELIKSDLDNNRLYGKTKSFLNKVLKDIDNQIQHTKVGGMNTNRSMNPSSGIDAIRESLLKSYPHIDLIDMNIIVEYLELLEPSKRTFSNAVKKAFEIGAIQPLEEVNSDSDY